MILSPEDSCRLISILLKFFVKNAFEKNAFFDFEKFEEVVSIAMRLSDDLVDLEIEKIDQILSKIDENSEQELWLKMRKACVNGRRTGLGTHRFS